MTLSLGIFSARARIGGDTAFVWGQDSVVSSSQLHVCPRVRMSVRTSVTSNPWNLLSNLVEHPDIALSQQYKDYPLRNESLASPFRDADSRLQASPAIIGHTSPHLRGPAAKPHYRRTAELMKAYAAVFGVCQLRFYHYDVP